MNINATLLGQFIALLMIIVSAIAWRLARRKSEHPALVTLICPPAHRAGWFRLPHTPAAPIEKAP
ncbi:hypothetical protein [Aeromonas sobria]|uniref:hypothetical protein n=1 Tax=Aeromonas sobria TaxID=646 RepID=UPI001115B512|nr:hypothetical protein [Aeromonas sobria]TNH88625.1 hypothetical protein CF140_01350 [Aeromonas sobria]